MTRFSPGKGVYAVADRDGAVLLDTAEDRLYGLNPTASALWERLGAGEDPREAADRLAAEWGVAEWRLRADFLTLVSELLDLGLIVPGEGAG